MFLAELFPCIFTAKVTDQSFRYILLAGTLLASGLCQAANPSGGSTTRPLAPRSKPAAGTMFTKLPPERTGIHAENRHDDPKMWGENFREFTYGSIGTGISIGDYDGDGQPDIFVVCKTAPNHLFRNLGDFRFEDVTEKAGVGGSVDAWKQGSVFADVN
ncbi:MAG TPA: VCBS repeat-containing protein, partial [Lacunisphaera sp.]|nr:VCBS repeat-containing protein [Lacunisphaera sp.]